MDEKALLTYLQLNYWNRDDIQIHSLRNITTGWETEILSFDLEWIENGDRKLQKLVARIYPGKNADVKVQREATTMKRLLELGYPVPAVHIVETEKSQLGQPFMIMDRIDGGTLDDKLHENAEKWMDEFSRLFVKLHQLDWKNMLDSPKTYPIDEFLSLICFNDFRIKIFSIFSLSFFNSFFVRYNDGQIADLI